MLILIDAHCGWIDEYENDSLNGNRIGARGPFGHG